LASLEKANPTTEYHAATKVDLLKKKIAAQRDELKITADGA
jgi:hypothetical protein